MYPSLWNGAVYYTSGRASYSRAPLGALVGSKAYACALDPTTDWTLARSMTELAGPAVLKHWRVTQERIEKYLSDIYFTDVNLKGR